MPHALQRALDHRNHSSIGLARTIYIRCIYGIIGRDITKYTVVYGVYVRSWPILLIRARIVES